MPSCLRVNVNQRDKPSEAEMGLTADDPSVLCYHSVADTPCVEPQAAGGNVWKYSKEHRAHHVGAGKEMVLTQAISSFCSPPTHRAGKSRETTMKVRTQEIMNKCEAQSTLKFSVPRKERARMGFGVLLLKTSCRQTLQALPSGSSGAPALSSPAGRNGSDSRSPIASELAEGPRTDL